MFGFGSKDKDKLEDNMEEIKKMVSQGEAGVGEQMPEEDSAEPQDRGFDTDTTDNFGGGSNQGQGFEDNQGFEDSQSFEDDTQSFESSQEEALDKFESQAQGPGTEENQVGGSEEPSFDKKFEEANQGFDQQPQQKNTSRDAPDQGAQANGQNQGLESQVPGTQNSQSEERREPEREQVQNESDSSQGSDSSLEKQIPKPAETKEINVPEIDKGPLFIRQEKFNSAVRMIEEMRYLSNEIESVVNRLEQGIQQDRETEREAKDILHSLEEDRSGVQDIISPRDEWSMAEKNELEEYLQEYKDANSSQKLLSFLKDRLIQELEDFPAEKERQKHDLNLLIRELEEELHWIESEKLSEFDPEQQ